ncbi:MAG: hypothetical protein NVSMB2_11290 [Chloroflexota bacterium]
MISTACCAAANPVWGAETDASETGASPTAYRDPARTTLLIRSDWETHKQDVSNHEEVGRGA